MKQFWLQKKECTACGACANICPKNAIELKTDECGFIYPVISDACIDCDACEKTCKKCGNHAVNNKKRPRTFATWSNDENIRYTSTSGGAFSELAQAVLEQGGSVVGAHYREDCMVEHVMVSDEEGLNRIKQSKYIQSEIGLVLREVKKVLLTGKLVAFCGAPCQVAGLYAYLGRDYDNLITFDFICRGMNSPKAYRSWLNEIEEQQKSKVTRVWFKYKMGGWKKSPRCTRLDFENGQHLVHDQDENLFMTGYLGPNLYIRSSCSDCKFKSVPRQADITLADFWGIEPEYDDDKGTSMLLVNSEKGAELFEKVKTNMTVHEREFEEIFAGNVCFESSVIINPKSEEFLKSLDHMVFSQAIKKYTRKSILSRIKSKVKKILKKIIRK